MTANQKQNDAATTPRESIVGSNICTMCLYNIPRATVMITLPGLMILVCGAAMTAFIDGSWSWTDGLSMIALVCLVLGGAWTLVAVVFWFVAWWRLKPQRKPRRSRSNLISAGHDNPAVQLEAVISRPCDMSSDRTTSDVQTRGIKTDSEKVDTCASVCDEVVYTVP